MIDVKKKSEQGFVAITSAIVISVLLVIIGASLGYAGFFTRFNILETEFKEMSLGKAEACAESARIEIAKSASYSVSAGSPETLYINGQTCQILSVSQSGTQYTIRTQGQESSSFSNIEAVVTRGSSTVAVDSWIEVPAF